MTMPESRPLKRFLHLDIVEQAVCEGLNAHGLGFESGMPTCCEEVDPASISNRDIFSI